jgi:hypothetical protein
MRCIVGAERGRECSVIGLNQCIPARILFDMNVAVAVAVAVGDGDGDGDGDGVGVIVE